MGKPLTHPALSAPADVIYFVGWIEPRPAHFFAVFLRFIAGNGVYQQEELGSSEGRAKVAKAVGDHCKRVDWRALELAVSVPGVAPAASPLAYKGTPIVLWPKKDTVVMMKPRGGGSRPGGGHAA
jgi:hypothetical protein